MSTSNSWPFEDPPNVMCFTVKSIVQVTKPLLMVSRDAEDAGWSFLTGEPLEMSEALLVTLRSMVERDQTLLELADLPQDGLQFGVRRMLAGLELRTRFPTTPPRTQTGQDRPPVKARQFARAAKR